MTFKEAQDTVAQNHGYASWAAIKWFELDQRRSYDGKTGPAFNELIEEAAEFYKDEALKLVAGDNVSMELSLRKP